MRFADVKRPISMDTADSIGGIKCPEGLTPCNPNASPSNVYCVSPEVVSADQCPITDIKVITDDEVLSSEA